jgi:hypothetical protein
MITLCYKNYKELKYLKIYVIIILFVRRLPSICCLGFVRLSALIMFCLPLLLYMDLIRLLSTRTFYDFSNATYAIHEVIAHQLCSKVLLQALVNRHTMTNSLC